MSDVGNEAARPTDTPAECEPGAALAYRRYRVSVRRHDFREQQLKVLDFVLCHSYGRHDGRPKAWVPAQWCIAECCGMDRGDCSKTLKWLAAQRVIEVLNCSTSKCPFALWVAILPPDSWRVPLNESAEASGIEEWLLVVDDPDHPELWPAPQSLNDALREVYVEQQQEFPRGHKPRGGETARYEDRGQGAPGQASRECEVPTGPGTKTSRNRSESVKGELTGQPVGKLPSPSHGDATGPGGRVGEFPSQAGVAAGAAGAGVGSFPTLARASSTREDREPEKSSRQTRARVLLDLEKEAGSYSDAPPELSAGRAGALTEKARVEDALWKLIGGHERYGKCGRMWRRAIDQIPDFLNVKIHEALDMQRCGKLRNSAGAFMNRVTYEELSRRDAEARPVDSR